MSEFEKEMYLSMTSQSRSVAYLAKVFELIEFAKIMKKEDMKFLKSFHEGMKKDDR